MDKIVINGGFPLNGEIEISGAKNSAIKLMAVPLLTDQPVELTNMPNLRDTRFMAKLLEHLGVLISSSKKVMLLLRPRVALKAQILLFLLLVLARQNIQFSRLF